MTDSRYIANGAFAVALLWPAAWGGWVLPRVVLLTVAALLLVAGQPTTHVRPPRAVQIALGITATAAALSLAFADDPWGVATGGGDHWTGLVTLSYAVLLGCVVGARIDTAAVTYPLVIVLALQLVTSAVQLGLGVLDRPVGTLGSATDLGLLAAVAEVWLAARARGWTLWTGLALSGALVGMSGSRAALAGLVLGLTVLVGTRRLWRPAVAALFGFIVGALPLAWRWTATDALTVTSATDRLAIWGQSWPLVTATWHGAGQAYADAITPTGAISGARLDDPHSIIVWAGAYGGWPLLITGAVLAVAVAVWLLRARAWEALAVLAALSPTVLVSPWSLSLATVTVALATSLIPKATETATATEKDFCYA